MKANEPEEVDDGISRGVKGSASQVRVSTYGDCVVLSQQERERYGELNIGVPYLTLDVSAMDKLVQVWLAYRRDQQRQVA